VSPEITDATNARPVRGWILYDGECPLCVRLAQRAAPLLSQHRFVLTTLQSDWVLQRRGLEAGTRPIEMGLLTPAGSYYGGADALVHIAGRIWWTWPLYAVSRVPGVMRPLRALYRFIARRRHCGVKGCPAPTRSTQRRKRVFFDLP
jgi:predicted DCC family thiol-disulfide oxidoreductase YuxK